MDWTDCPIIEQIPGKLSGAPVLKGSRVRPEDLIANIEEGSEWLAEAHFLPIEQVRAVLAFYEANRAFLPTDFVSPERRRAMSSAPAL